MIDSHSKEPLIASTVYVKGSSEQTITDIDGLFNLRVEKKYKKAIVVVSYIGYETKEIEVKFDKMDHLMTVQLELDGAIMGDVVVITGMVAKNRLNLWQRFKNLFRSKEKHCTVE